MDTIAAKIEKSGRILIPAEWRRRLGLGAGSEVILRIEAGGIRILGTREQAAQRIQKRLERYVRPGRLVSEELIADRRREAKREGLE